ncbi:MAG: hypothetical protein WAM85_05220 [Terracidiphilus sp.]
MKKNVEEFVRLAVQGFATRDERSRGQSLFDALSRDEKKQTIESRAFLSFAGATNLIADPLKHSNEEPPQPDICTEINGSKYHFELGEITDENLAEGIATSLRTRMVSGCALSQAEPLARMIAQKCQNRYETNGTPVDLLLYYWRQGPYLPTIEQYFTENGPVVESWLMNSEFKSIWIYDMDSKKVLWRAHR